MVKKARKTLEALLSVEYAVLRLTKALKWLSTQLAFDTISNPHEAGGASTLRIRIKCSSIYPVFSTRFLD